MYEVEIRIIASGAGYKGKLSFKDQKGKVHEREFAEECDASKAGNTLYGIMDAVKRLTKPCMLTIYVNDDSIAAAFQNGWVLDWQQHNWTNKKGNPVRHAKVWEALWELLKNHSRRVIYEEYHPEQ